MEVEETTPVAEVPAQEVQTPPSNEAPEQDDSNPSEDDAELQSEDELEEVAFGGKAYKLPKELAPYIAKAENLEAGYTRKFQEAAELRKTAEAEREAFVREQQITSQLGDEVVQLKGVDQRLAQYQQVDWQAWQATNPQAANAAIAEMVQLQNAQHQLRGNIEARKTELGAAHERQVATMLSQAVEVLNKPDPKFGWSGKFTTEVSTGLTKFANEELGIPLERLRRATDPTEIKTLHLAKLGFEALKRNKAAATPPKAAAEPVPTVTAGKTRSNTVDPERMSQKQFNEWRERQSKGRG